MKGGTHPKPTPPRWATCLLRWFCNDHLSEAVLGDLVELYERRFEKLGKRKADLLFIANVIQFLQPFAFRKRNYRSTLNQRDMFQNYFKIAWRTMSRQKMYAGITIGGFALGLATCLVIFLFIRQELSYDKHYADGDRIFRLYNDNIGPQAGRWASVPPPVAGILRTDFPEVEKSGRLMPVSLGFGTKGLVRREDAVENNYEEGFGYADPELLEILEIPMVYGTTSTALDKPNTIVLSKRKADIYFPNEDPRGKSIILNDDKSKLYTIGGVMKDMPENTHFQFDFLISLKEQEFWPGEQSSWCCWNYNVYVKLRSGADPLALEKKMTAMCDTHFIKYLEEQGDQSAADVKKNHFFRLQPVGNIYLKSDGIYDEMRHGDMRYIWLFGGVAAFILLLACINFINLSTAKSANRAKEVGLRKTAGSVRGYLITQFLTESVFYSLVSFAIALVMVWVALPFFNTLAGKSLTIPWLSWWFFPLLAAAMLFIGVAAGLYPSFYLSAFKPIDVLKGSVSRGSKSSTLRSTMVVFQFTTSIILIIGTLIIYRQMNYLLTTKTGFEKEQVVVLYGTHTLNNQQLTFRDELLGLADVQQVSISSYLPVNGGSREGYGFWRKGREKADPPIGSQKWRVDADYISTMKMRIVEGRDFNRELASDSQAAVVNQAFVKEFGLKKPVGEQITNGPQTFTIIGVVEDFNYESMKKRIKPLSLVIEGGGNSVMTVRVKSKDMQATLGSITKKWNKFLPHQPFRYGFLDESYARMYDDVQRMGRIFAGFATLAIIVACLGLFALSAFMVEQRSKEISIRLVLGATTQGIFQLLTQNFVKLVFISIVIATPLAWYLVKTWLADYNYKIPITWDVFALAGAMSIFIALSTVSYQSFRAALANPAKSLRSE
ncbi:MAG TPA: ABC transporter permease [Chryseolinea sp.]